MPATGKSDLTDSDGRCEAEYQEEERKEEDQETLPQAHEAQLTFTRRAVSIRPQVKIRRVSQDTELQNNGSHREKPQAGRPNSTTENAITYM